MGQTQDDDVMELRHKAETLMRRARPRAEVEPILDKILRLAGDGTEPSLFAHRHLAEMRIERNPWQAALHLRAVMRTSTNDDVLHALMGLCQALLGNFRAAVTSYRRALSITPKNPWYHHNLGHLLDVALGDPDAAKKHLESAHDLEPLEDEITASLAHCLANNGDIVEARTLAFDAMRASPRNASHKALVQWIDRGAPAGEGPHARSEPRVERPNKAKALDPVKPATKAATERVESVSALLAKSMKSAGVSNERVAAAMTLWRDYVGAERVRVTKPEVCAAAVEYAILHIRGEAGDAEASLAKRYGVTPRSMQDRFAKLCDALQLAPHDPRY